METLKEVLDAAVSELDSLNAGCKLPRQALACSCVARA
eukprot:COSAG02_NODE_64265_length_261_cov_0.617284_1_plen_37_part_01